MVLLLLTVLAAACGPPWPAGIYELASHSPPQRKTNCGTPEAPFETWMEVQHVHDQLFRLKVGALRIHRVAEVDIDSSGMLFVLEAQGSESLFMLGQFKKDAFSGFLSIGEGVKLNGDKIVGVRCYDDFVLSPRKD